ncbi:hypothetical protein [uncultured Kordia sp.]|uniref:hypothetical protein n=1 Tax=uncultured Kordia sp. TaxID=507699 RepID=UPI00262D04F1|nr:hypothetical protein [uncultured Kordia sp.]
MNSYIEKNQTQHTQTSQTPVAQAKTDTTVQLVDNRPTTVIQQKTIQKMHNHGSGVVQLGKKQDKQKKAAAAAKKSKQSKADRNAYRALQYETTSKKDGKAKQDLARKVKGTIAHGTGDKSKGKQGKTKKELAEINKKLKQAKKQARANKKHQDWLDRSDKNDRGGAGGGHGVLVSAN